MTNSKGMTAKNVRREFEKRMSEALLPKDFFYMNKCFWRIHPNEVILCVNLYFYTGGGFDIDYSIFPFCLGYTHIEAARGMYPVSAGIRAENGIIGNAGNIYETPYPDLLGKLFETFFGLIYEQFTAIDCLNKHLSFLRYIGREPTALECFYLKRYDEATKILERNIEFQRQNIRERHNEYEKQLKYVQEAKHFQTRKMEQKIADMKRDEIDSASDYLAELQRMLHQIKEEDYDELNEMILRNCASTVAACQKIGLCKTNEQI